MVVPAPSPQDQALRARVRANRRRTRVLEALVAAVVALGAFAVAGALLALAGVGLVAPVALGVAAGVVAVLLLRRSDALALRLLGARLADPVAHARLHNLVEGLCAGAGLPEPRLFVVDDEAPNSLALGRDPASASLVATLGLLDRLGRIELEGVVAHELSHVKARDTAPATAAVLVALVAPGLVPRFLPPEREALADAAGVALTRYPPGLVSALEKLADDPSAVRAHRAVAHLWLEPPVAGALDERLAILHEL